MLLGSPVSNIDAVEFELKEPEFYEEIVTLRSIIGVVNKMRPRYRTVLSS